MKSLIKPASLLFYLLVLLTAFILGLFYAGLIDAGKNQGLAGGAIVLGYGVSFSFVSLIIALFLTYYLQNRIIVIFNKVLAILFAISALFLVYRILSKERESKATVYSGVQVNLVSYSIGPEAIYTNRQVQQNPPIGLGMFAPNQSEEIPLYFYGNPNLDKSILEHSPYDSMTFMPVEVGGFTIATAPPWLMPHHMKLDYGVLYFKVVGVTEDFLEVIVNSRTNQTAFVDRRAGKMMYWPDFFHSINSVELIGEQKVYVKPLDHAGTTSTPYSFLRPVRIRQQWMEVRLVNDAFEEVDKGWIRWHADGRMLISYNLFS